MWERKLAVTVVSTKGRRDIIGLFPLDDDDRAAEVEVIALEGGPNPDFTNIRSVSRIFVVLDPMPPDPDKLPLIKDGER